MRGNRIFSILENNNTRYPVFWRINSCHDGVILLSKARIQFQDFSHIRERLAWHEASPGPHRGVSDQTLAIIFWCIVAAVVTLLLVHQLLSRILEYVVYNVASKDQ